VAGIEFLPQEVDDEPAQLEPRAPRPAWMLGGLRVAVVAAVIAGLAVWIATRPSGPAQHRPTQAAVTKPTLPQHDIRPAPTVTKCTTGAPVPDEVTQAMRRFLDGIVIKNLLTNRCVSRSVTERRIQSETVNGSLGPINVEVALSMRNAEFPPAFQTTPAVGRPTTLLGSVETESAGVKVRISAVGKGGTRAPMYQLQRLADYLSLNTVL
jgi:hypothetical protein